MLCGTLEFRGCSTLLSRTLLLSFRLFVCVSLTNLPLEIHKTRKSSFISFFIHPFFSPLFFSNVKKYIDGAKRSLFSWSSAFNKTFKEKERCIRKDRRIGKRCRDKHNKKVTAFVRPSGLGFSNSGMAAKEKKIEKGFFSTLPDKVIFLHS